MAKELRISPSYSKKVLSVEDKFEILKLLDSRTSYSTIIRVMITYSDLFTNLYLNT